MTNPCPGVRTFALFALASLVGCTTPPETPVAQPPIPLEKSGTGVAGPDTNQVDAKPDAPRSNAFELGESTLEVTALQHASMLWKWNEIVVYVDPVKGALDAGTKGTAAELPKADLIIVTDIHGDHFEAETVASLLKEGGTIVAPKAVADKAGKAWKDPLVLANGDKKEVLEGRIQVEATPMYNLVRKRPDSGEPFHVKGRGNGYLVGIDGKKIYISGDTECIPEMKALTDVDAAFVCMNLPYTMPVEEAAECVKAFEPKVLYPYHHRDQDTGKLDKLLDGSATEIRMLNWYPAKTPSPNG